MFIPQNYKLLKLYQGAANAVDCDVVCCKGVHKVWFVISHNGANDTDLTLTLTEATDVAAGTTSAVTATCPIWLDADAGTTSDTLVAQTEAAAITIDPATQGSALAIIEWNPVKHTAGYDCITLADSGGHADNTIAILAVVDMRYPQETPPSVITD